MEWQYDIKFEFADEEDTLIFAGEEADEEAQDGFDSFDSFDAVEYALDSAPDDEEWASPLFGREPRIDRDVPQPTEAQVTAVLSAAAKKWAKDDAADPSGLLETLIATNPLLQDVI
jgi:hypothetical protein